MRAWNAAIAITSGSNQLKSTNRPRAKFQSSASPLERRITNSVLWLSFVVALAFFSTMLFSHSNTFRIVEPIIRWFAPDASAHTLATAHNVGRKMGHFFIPAVAFWVLVLGPLRNRPLVALLACIAFACLDEGLQTYSPDRSGSLLDVMLDTFGALFGFFVHHAIQSWHGPRAALRKSRRVS